MQQPLTTLTASLVMATGLNAADMPNTVFISHPRSEEPLGNQ